jgi:phosphoglycolate phosphatase-like HAD superfamily hydrolase
VIAKYELHMSKDIKSDSLVIFDMDGVIIDVSASYRETVRQTARLFLKGARCWEDLPDPLFPLSDLARVKQSGGLNNDWDLTYLVIRLLFTLVKGTADTSDPDPWSGYQTMIRGCDAAALAQYLKSMDRPVSSLLEKMGKARQATISRLFKGDVGSGNVIKQIFQEIYLGKDLFESTYGIPARTHTGSGLINREKLLVDRTTLEYLSGRHSLAIATGRPRAEADHPLDHFGLRQYFITVYTLDDCIAEEKRILEQQKEKVSLSKPNPYMLDAIAGEMKHEVSEFYYIGDMPDDMLAASRSAAGFIGIGILVSAPDKNSLKEQLQRAGADYVVEDFKVLKEIL